MVGKFREFCCLSLLYLMCPPGAGAQDRLVQEYIEIASNAVTSVESQTGNYQFVAGGTSINETNTVTVRYVSDNSRVGVVGGGFTRDQSSRWGIRADLRAHIHEDVSRTQLDASSRVAVGTPGSRWHLVPIQPSLSPILLAASSPVSKQR